MNLKKLTDPVVSKLKSQCSINVWKCNFQAASDSVTHTGKRASQTNHQKREFSKRKQRNIFLLRILDLAFLLLSNMQNGFIRTKVGVSLKKKFSLEKSEKKFLKTRIFPYQVAIRDVTRCRFARRVQTGLQRCKFCKVQSQSCASAPSQLFAAPREFRADPARLLANSFSC